MWQQLNSCLNTSEVTLKNIEKYVAQFHYELVTIPKPSKTLHVFNGILKMFLCHYHSNMVPLLVNLLYHPSGVIWSGVEFSGTIEPLIASFMGPTWGPSGADRTQVGPMLADELCYLGPSGEGLGCNWWDKDLWWEFLRQFRSALLSGEPDYFGRNKILSGYDLSHYQVPHCIRVFFYFVWFVFIHHNFQFYFKLCTYCNILDIYLS